MASYFVKAETNRAVIDMSLKSNFDGGIVTRGCIFNIKALHDTHITSFDINANEGKHQVIIYAKNGTHEGYELDSLEYWSQIANISVDGNGPFIPTKIPVGSFDPILITENQTQALFFMMDSENMIVTRPRSVMASTGSLLATNSILELYRGIGVQDPFEYILPYPVEWNGVIYFKAYDPNNIRNVKSSLNLSCGDEVQGTTILQTHISADKCGWNDKDESGFKNGFSGSMKYSFKENFNAQVTISLCNDVTNFNTQIRIFRETKDGHLVCVDGNNDSCGSQSSITFFYEAGNTYIILIDGHNNEEGNFKMNIICPTPMERLRPIEQVSCGKLYQGTTLGSSPISAPRCEIDKVDDVINYDKQNGAVKYTFKEERNRMVTMNLCGGTDFDSRIRVFEKDINRNNAFTCISSNDDFCDLQSSVTFAGKANIEYVVIVDGHRGDGGFYNLEVQCPNPDIVNHIRQSFVMLESELSESHKKIFASTVQAVSLEYVTKKYQSQVMTLVNIVKQQSTHIRRGDGNEYEITLDYLISFSSHTVNVADFVNIFVEHLSHNDNLRRFEDDLMFNGVNVMPGRSSHPKIYDPIEEQLQSLRQTSPSTNMQLVVLISGICFFAAALLICLYLQVHLWRKFSNISEKIKHDEETLSDRDGSDL